MLLYKTVVRVPKNQSSFLYFMLESNEGIAFYSTLDYEVGCPYRDIEMTCTLDFKEDLLHLLEVLRKDFPIDVLSEKEFLDE